MRLIRWNTWLENQISVLQRSTSVSGAQNSILDFLAAPKWIKQNRWEDRKKPSFFETISHHSTLKSKLFLDLKLDLLTHVLAHFVDGSSFTYPSKDKSNKTTKTKSLPKVFFPNPVKFISWLKARFYDYEMISILFSTSQVSHKIQARFYQQMWRIKSQLPTWGIFECWDDRLKPVRAGTGAVWTYDESLSSESTSDSEDLRSKLGSWVEIGFWVDLPFSTTLPLPYVRNSLGRLAVRHLLGPLVLQEIVDESSFSQNGMDPARLKQLLKNGPCNCKSQCSVPYKLLLKICQCFWSLPKENQDALLWSMQAGGSRRTRWSIEGVVLQICSNMFKFKVWCLVIMSICLFWLVWFCSRPQ